MNRGQGKRVSQVTQTKKLDEAASADHIARTAPRGRSFMHVTRRKQRGTVITLEAT